MPKTILSIENCIRFFKTGIQRDSFLTFQIPILKKLISTSDFFLKIFAEDSLLLEQNFLINKDKIVFLNSHEDPIIQSSDTVFLSIHISKELLHKKPDTINLEISDTKQIVYNEQFNNLPYKSLFDSLNSEIVNDLFIKSNQDCDLTLHLGNAQSKYTEEHFVLKKDELFDFSSYLSQFTYIGVQCSYESKSPEIEEKFIIKGQKGIYETGTYKNAYVSQLAFKNVYINQYDEFNQPELKFKEVYSIDEVINFHQSFPIHYFQTNFYFLIEHYKNNTTYSQSNLFSSKKLRGVVHTSNDICHHCPSKAVCLQIIPSGLSYDLFKENLSKSQPVECRVFQLIKQKNISK